MKTLILPFFCDAYAFVQCTRSRKNVSQERCIRFGTFPNHSTETNSVEINFNFFFLFFFFQLKDIKQKDNGRRQSKRSTAHLRFDQWHGGNDEPNVSWSSHRRCMAYGSRCLWTGILLWRFRNSKLHAGEYGRQNNIKIKNKTKNIINFT